MSATTYPFGPRRTVPKTGLNLFPQVSPADYRITSGVPESLHHGAA